MRITGERSIPARSLPHLLRSLLPHPDPLPPGEREVVASPEERCRLNIQALDLILACSTPPEPRTESLQESGEGLDWFLEHSVDLLRDRDTLTPELAWAL